MSSYCNTNQGLEFPRKNVETIEMEFIWIFYVLFKGWCADRISNTYSSCEVVATQISVSCS